MTDGTGKGSWYSQFHGRYQWADNEDRPNSNALGVPDSAQGVSFYEHDTLGRWFEITAPNGMKSLEQQTEIGPNPRTGRGIDISAAAAERLGYSPNNFPTDGVFSWQRVPAPAEVAGLSPQKQAAAYRDLRQGILRPGESLDAHKPIPEPTEVWAKPSGDALFVPKAIALAKTSLMQVQHAAARDLYNYDGEVYPRDGCAITQYDLWLATGMLDPKSPKIYQALAFGKMLMKRGWKQIPVGQQQPGDVGSTCNPDGPPVHGVDHVYLVLSRVNDDEMVIADNQQPQPHFRWASGKGGKSPTKFFLRA